MMGQRTQTSGRSNFMNPASVPPVEVDYIVCGLCQRDFPLANIMSFMQHKKFDCDDYRDYQGFRSRILLCKSCPRKFSTPWRLLQHAQSVHSLHIYFEQADLLNPLGILPESTVNGTNEVTFIDKHSSTYLHSTTLSKASIDLHNYSLSVPDQGNHGIFLQETSAADSMAKVDKMQTEQMMGNTTKFTQHISVEPANEVIPSNSQEGLETSMVNHTERESTPSNSDEGRAMDNTVPLQVSGQNGEVDSGSASSPVITSQKTNVINDGVTDISSDGDKCCDNQDCGITLMPGTHEEPKKCCNAVVPKKRKRHMQTKHMSGTGRLKKRSSSTADKYKPRTQTVFIDIDPSPDSDQNSSRANSTPEASMHHVASEVEINSSDKAALSADKPISPSILENQGTELKHVKIQPDRVPSEPTNPPSSQQTTYIIEPGTTFSIPVSGNVDLAASRFSNTISQSIDGVHNKQAKLATDAQSNMASQMASEDSENEIVFIDTISDQSHFPGLSKLMIGVGSEQAIVSLPEGGGSIVSKALDTTEKGHGVTTRKLNLKAIGERRRRYPTSKPFKCDKCSQAFNQRIHLKKHQSKHTGIKPFQCEQCDYSTVEKSHLKVHIRVHTGEKPFKCTYCEYATAQNSTLKIHLKRHLQGTAGVRCLQCRKEFAEPECLTTHSKTEHQSLRQVIMPDAEGPLENRENQIYEHQATLQNQASHRIEHRASLESPTNQMIQPGTEEAAEENQAIQMAEEASAETQAYTEDPSINGVNIKNNELASENHNSDV